MTLAAPPFVHPHEQATKPGPKILQFRLVIQEKEIVIDNEGTKLQAMTFNGSIPGPLSAHEGDYLEVTLVNPETNSMPHNIDFHAGENDLYIPRDAKGSSTPTDRRATPMRTRSRSCASSFPPTSCSTARSAR